MINGDGQCGKWQTTSALTAKSIGLVRLVPHYIHQINRVNSRNARPGIRQHYKYCPLIQPRGAVVAAKQKAVCFTAVMLLLFLSFFILQADISTLAAWNFAILVSFNQKSLQILVSVQKSGRSAP